jgi:hypothetical protein
MAKDFSIKYTAESESYENLPRLFQPPSSPEFDARSPFEGLPSYKPKMTIGLRGVIPFTCALCDAKFGEIDGQNVFSRGKLACRRHFLVRMFKRSKEFAWSV